MTKRAYEVTVQRRVTQVARICITDADDEAHAIHKAEVYMNGLDGLNIWETAVMDVSEASITPPTVSASAPIEGGMVGSLAHYNNRGLNLIATTCDDAAIREEASDELYARLLNLPSTLATE